MANQQPDHDRIIEVFANSQAALRQSFIDLLQAGASIESLSGVYDAARSLEIASNNIGDDYEADDDNDDENEESGKYKTPPYAMSVAELHRASRLGLRL